MRIISGKYIISSAEYQQCPAPTKPEYAFIGRSNVGKSSLINMVTGQHHLAKTSGTPGKTQLINHFGIEVKNSVVPELFFVDLPGYGYAKVSISNRKKWEKMIDDYLRKRENLCRVFVLVDGRHKPQKIDLAFIEDLYFKHIPIAIIITKADKEKPGVVERNRLALIEALHGIMQFIPAVFVTSANTKAGKDEILELIHRENEEWLQRD